MNPICSIVLRQVRLSGSIVILLTFSSDALCKEASPDRRERKDAHDPSYEIRKIGTTKCWDLDEIVDNLGDEVFDPFTQGIERGVAAQETGVADGGFDLATTPKKANTSTDANGDPDDDGAEDPDEGT